jgi:hypothetical protein
MKSEKKKGEMFVLNLFGFIVVGSAATVLFYKFSLTIWLYRSILSFCLWHVPRDLYELFHRYGYMVLNIIIFLGWGDLGWVFVKKLYRKKGTNEITSDKDYRNKAKEPQDVIIPLWKVLVLTGLTFSVFMWIWFFKNIQRIHKNVKNPQNINNLLKLRYILIASLILWSINIACGTLGWSMTFFDSDFRKYDDRESEFWTKADKEGRYWEGSVEIVDIDSMTVDREGNLIVDKKPSYKPGELIYRGSSVRVDKKLELRKIISILKFVTQVFSWTLLWVIPVLVVFIYRKELNVKNLHLGIMWILLIAGVVTWIVIWHTGAFQIEWEFTRSDYYAIFLNNIVRITIFAVTVFFTNHYWIKLYAVNKNETKNSLC